MVTDQTSETTAKKLVEEFIARVILRSTQTRAGNFRAICLRQSANCFGSPKLEPPLAIRLQMVKLNVSISLCNKWFAAISTDIRLFGMSS